MTKCYLTVSVEAERFLTSLTEGISICLSRALSVLASWIPTFTVISLYTNLELAKTLSRECMNFTIDMRIFLLFISDK